MADIEHAPLATPGLPDLSSRKNLVVRDLMSRPVHTLHHTANLAEVNALMQEQRIRHVPIIEDGCRLLGLVTHRDLLRRAMGGGEHLPDSIRGPYLRSLPVAETMIGDVITTGPDVPIKIAARVMMDHKFGCLPVVEDGRLVGILTEVDFVHYVARDTDRTGA
jgi:CBS domain-containing membrane protein